MIRILAFAVLLSGGTLLTGCGDDPECAIDTDCPLYQRCTSDNRCVPLGAPDATPDASGDAMPDASDAEAGPMDAGMPDAEPVGTGTISLVASPAGTTSASAVFSNDATEDDESCSVMSFPGTPCELITCTRELPSIPDGGMDASMDAEPPTDGGMPDATPSIAPNPGAINVMGASGSILLVPDGTDGIFAPASGTTPWSTESPSVTITADGTDAVGAFSLDMQGPLGLTVTNDPPLESLTSLTAGTQFDVQWTGSSAGTLVLRLSPTSWEPGETSRRALHCPFPLDPATTEGSGVVQGSLISQLPAGRSYSLQLQVEASAETMTGPWLIQGVASAQILTSSGATFTGSTITINGS